ENFAIASRFEIASYKDMRTRSSIAPDRLVFSREEYACQVPWEGNLPVALQNDGVRNRPACPGFQGAAIDSAHQQLLAAFLPSQDATAGEPADIAGSGGVVVDAPEFLLCASGKRVDYQSIPAHSPAPIRHRFTIGQPGEPAPRLAGRSIIDVLRRGSQF